MKAKNYNTVEEFTSAIESCISVDDAADVLQKAKADTGDFAYLNIRYVLTNLPEPSGPNLITLFSEADPEFKEFASSGCKA